jgi:hypothetical protein
MALEMNMGEEEKLEERKCEDKHLTSQRARISARGNMGAMGN